MHFPLCSIYGFKSNHLLDVILVFPNIFCRVILYLPRNNPLNIDLLKWSVWVEFELVTFTITSTTLSVQLYQYKKPIFKKCLHIPTFQYPFCSLGFGTSLNLNNTALWGYLCMEFMATAHCSIFCSRMGVCDMHLAKEILSAYCLYVPISSSQSS